MTTGVASGRYGMPEPPDGLVLTCELINTIGHPRPPVAPDLLARLATAQPWLDATVSAWCELREVPDPEIDLDETGLRHLRALRATLRGVVGRGVSGPGAVAAGIDVTIGNGGVGLAPAGTGVQWLRGAVAIEWVVADQLEGLRRLKLCRNGDCGIAFYDRSKNNSRVWHDVTRCGNATNVRAYRARQRAGHEQ